MDMSSFVRQAQQERDRQMQAQLLRQQQMSRMGAATPTATSNIDSGTVQGPQVDSSHVGNQVKQGYENTTNFAQNQGVQKLGQYLNGVGRGLFGGVNGADIGAGAAQYGPEVAKMGGNVVGGGAGAGQAIGNWTNSLFGGGSGMGGGAGPYGAAAMVALNAGKIGDKAGGVIDSAGLKKTGFGDMARGFGNFVSGDFGGAADNVGDLLGNYGSTIKSGLKKIFDIF